VLKNHARRLAAFSLAAALFTTALVASPSPAEADSCPCSFFEPSAVPTHESFSDSAAVEVGMKFTPEVDGVVSAIRFYKGAGNTGTHTGRLWSDTGSVLADATFQNETATGWQQATLSSEVTVFAGTTYVVSYHAPNGHYAASTGYFTQAQTNSHLSTPVNAGVFQYGTTGFPTSSYGSANYWVDVVFDDNGPSLPAQTEPIGLVTSESNPFSAYYGEILRGEGLNEFTTIDIDDVTKNELAEHRSIVLGEMALTNDQVALFTEYVNNGGQLVAMRPDEKLAPLLGLTDAGTTLSDQYLKLSSASEVTAGITQETMQFHGTADTYSLNGATSLGTLYSSVNTATSFPAVTMRSVGMWGGRAASFTYDLAKSVVLTRQGNPAWSGQNRDGDLLTRSDDLFYGNAANDPQPDWVNLDKVQIPQADEQQHVLSNLLTSMTLDDQPLPRFWFLPNGKKAAVIETGDDHGNNGTTARFQQYEQLSPPNCDVDNWECVRGTSYVYPGTPITQANAQQFTNKGFEIAAHISSNCAEWTPQSLDTNFTNDLAQFSANFPTLPAPETNRLHCIVWSDFNSQAKVSADHGIRLDTNYYYFPGSWVQNRPGLFTGSGQILKFADPDGTLIDVYQAATQLTDESLQTYPFHTATLLDNALGPKGYYAMLTTNHHTDQGVIDPSTSTVVAAQQRGVPVVSAKQMLTWLDGRNASTFTDHNWENGELSFDVSVGVGAEGLIRAMVPVRSEDGILTTLQSNGVTVPFTTENIKGVEYAFFAATNASYTATYVPDTTAPAITSTVPANDAEDVDPGAVLTATAGEALRPITVNSSTVTVTANGTPVSGSVSYDSSSRVITFDPSSSLALDTNHVFTVKSGATGVKDLAGNALTTDRVTQFTTAAFTTATIFPDSTVPVTTSYPDTGAYTLGVKFQSAADGYITGVRFYKGANNSGTHTGGLWNASGQLLASGSFTDESATGWQTLTFATPAAITANTTYTAGYVTPNGGYAADAGGLATPQGSGTLQSLSGGGVYSPGATLTHPTTSAPSNMNYYVDAVYQSALDPDVVPPTPTSQNLFGEAVPGVTSAADTSSVELGTRFSSTVNGTISGIRFYKGAGNTGTHTGTLWSASGGVIASGTFQNETASGWQTLEFTNPVSITAGTTYVASYFAPNGGYAYNGGYFGIAHASGPLQAPAGSNGVFTYSSNSTFPTSSYNSTNYWVDVIFDAA
jgi:hypothetical protein